MQNIKSILVLVAVLVLSACKNTSSNKVDTNEEFYENVTNEVVNIEEQNRFKLNELIEVTENEQFSKEDFNRIKFVWQGKRDPNSITTLQSKRIRNTALDPFENDNTVSLMSWYGHEISPTPYVKNEVLLPMRFHSHEMYTLWNSENDSLRFIKFLKPSQSGRYESSIVDSIFEINEVTIISGMTLGGEGGETWNSFWLKQVINDSIIELERTPIQCDAHIETHEYKVVYEKPFIQRTIFRDSIAKFKDTLVSIINVNELIKNEL